MEITPQSKLFDILEAYPQLETQIVNIAPPFKNLRNPVLRRTVGKLATLAQVAQVGGMDAGKLVNTLRTAVGQPEIDPQVEPVLRITNLQGNDDPEWISGDPQFTVNGTQMLAQGEVPLGRVNALLGQLDSERFLLLVTDFEPTPIFDAIQKQNRRVFHKTSPTDSTLYLTFIG